jgi:hypothetical protein
MWDGWGSMVASIGCRTGRAATAPMRRLAPPGGYVSPFVMSQACLAFAGLSTRGQRRLMAAGHWQPTRRSLLSAFVEQAGRMAPSRQVSVDELRAGTLRVTGHRVGSSWGGYRRAWAQVWPTLLPPLPAGEKGLTQVAGERRRHTALVLKPGRPPVGYPGVAGA